MSRYRPRVSLATVATSPAGLEWLSSIPMPPSPIGAHPRETPATLLLVIKGKKVTHVECQTQGGRRVVGDEFVPIGIVLEQLCARA